jgi:hypothetical protein
MVDCPGSWTSAVRDRIVFEHAQAVRRRFLDEDRIVWTGLCKGLDRVVDRNRGWSPVDGLVPL